MSFSAEDALDHARKLADRGETGKARQLYQMILERHPEREEARAAIAALEQRSSQLGALSALLEYGEFASVIDQGEALVERFPDSVILHNLLGIAHANLEQYQAAIRHFSSALSARPDMAQIHVNLGKALSSVGENEQAAAGFLRALQLKPDYVDAHYSLGMVLNAMARYQQAADHFFRALKLRPNFAEAEIHLGNALRELNRPDEAIDCFRRALAIDPDKEEAHVHLATIHHQRKRYPEAIAALENVLEIAPGRSDARALKLFLAAVICDWDMLAREKGALPGLGLSGKALQPFMMLALEDDPARHRTRSERLIEERYTLPDLGPIDRPPVPRPRIRLGYFSADFHEHAVMLQLIRVLELHDRESFEIYAYSYGPAAGDAMRARARQAVDVFREVPNLNGREIAELARQDGIDIAIDLMGHTRNARPQIFAYRAAPLQIAYLGYPGTTGAGFMDYMIADRVIIPEEQRGHYSEKIIFLPHAHMATDNGKAIADRHITRREMNLPETGFVFCCFNNSYKISPAEFDIWMRLLAQIEGSVLWLAGTNDLAQRNLAVEARKRGIDPGRLIFSERMGMAEHAARHRLADIFLDTFTYTGHSTASDALWAGLPVLTSPGKGVAARVAASLLTAIGLGDLTAQSPQDYERLALELARNPDRLAVLKQRLRENRLRMPLFDTERFTQDLESGYRLAYERFLGEEAPVDIAVKANSRN